jgi:RimJ/RimL family protein N-acetyltransferase
VVNAFVENLDALRQMQSGLQGELVLVRMWRPEDAAGLYRAIDTSRDHLSRWMDWVSRHQTIEDAQEYIARAAVQFTEGEQIGLGIFEGRDGVTVLGGTGYHEIDWTVPALETGYWITESAQGKGYVTETVKLLTNFAFGQLGANRMAIHCDPGNYRSRRVAERAGYRFEGQLRNMSRTPEGGLRDTLVFSMIPADRCH